MGKFSRRPHTQSWGCGDDFDPKEFSKNAMDRIEIRRADFSAWFRGFQSGAKVTGASAVARHTSVTSCH